MSLGGCLLDPPSFSEEFWHHAENRRIVVVEADDHATLDVDSALLDAMDALKKCASVRPHILVLFGLSERVFIRGLDANEHVLEIGETHQLRELVVLGEIKRGLGEKRQRVGLLLLPADDVTKPGLIAFLLPIRLSS